MLHRLNRHPSLPPSDSSFLLLRLLLISILVSLLPPSSCDDEEYKSTGYKECGKRPFSCGSRTIDVSYPFSDDASKPYCGHPLFELSCNSDESAITILIGEERYRVVRDIDYTERHLTIADERFFGEFCPLASADVQFHSEYFINSFALNSRVYLLSCSRFVPDLFKVPCSSNDKLVYLSVAYPTVSSEFSCSNPGVIWMNLTAVDLMKASNISSDEALQEGFIVTWTPPFWQNCSDCINSSGVCGFDNLTQEALCFFPNGTETTSSHHVGLIAGVCAGVGVLIAACFFALFFYCRRKRARRQPGVLLSQITTSSEPSNSKKDTEFLSGEDPNTQLFQYEELHEATDGFIASNEIGDGGFGTVYRGNLADGRVVAIKRLYENNYRRAEQFRTEVCILSSLRHPNLVTLYGCTSRHSRELLLVYEYVPNGTVACHLHGSRAGRDGLPWGIRMSIAIETAEALSYLHAVTPQIIHRDVKSNNILLDNHFHVKVADFGLSRLFPLDATHVSTLPQGTPGYLDPEYHQCYQLTDKSDVYSFGVVLAELISAKPAVDITRPRQEINLARLAIGKIQCDQLDQLVDPNLWRQGNSEVIWMVNRVAEVAFQCLQADRETRPTMREVSDALRRIEDEARSRAKGAKDHGMAKDVECLLNDATPQSPDTVIATWDSRKTTPHTSV